jgi:hypothetical protein
MEWKVPKLPPYQGSNDLIGALVDDINSPCSYNISNVALVDAIFYLHELNTQKIWKYKT